MNCILTTLVGTPLPAYERLIHIKKLCKDTELNIFVSEGDVRRFIKQFHQIHREHRINFLLFEGNFSLQDIAYIERFKFYDVFLRKNQYPDGKIFLMDGRDIIFQNDLFEYKTDKDLTFFEEKRIIEDNGDNRTWIKLGFGEEVYNNIKDRKVICSGTTLGTYKGICNYLKQMVQTSFKHKYLDGLERGGNIADQGIHNYLIYTNKFTNFETIDNDGPVNTYAHDDSHVDDNGFITNKNKKINAVVHQFDRLSKENLLKIKEKRNINIDDLIANRS